MTLPSSMSEVELIRACAESNDGTAWDEFVSRFHRPISLSIVRTAYQWGAIPQQVVDDVVQETYLKLCANGCKLLLEFASQHPEAILGYIKTMAVNVTHDHFKALHSRRRGASETDQLIDGSGHEAEPTAGGGPVAIEQEVLIGQINQCLETCAQGPDYDRDCMIFWLHYQQGMSAKDIAALPAVGLTAKGVESAIFRLTGLVREKLVGMRSRTGRKPPGEEKGFLPAGSY